MNDTTAENTKLSWWRRLSSGLRRTSNSLGTAVADLVTKRKLDRAMLEDIEDVLLRADLGTEVAERISEAVGVGRYDKSITEDDVKAVVASEVEKVLMPVAKPLAIDEKAVRHSGGWRQRFRQDHHHRQAGSQTSFGTAQGDAGRRRHFSCRRYRAVEDMGRAHQIARGISRTGFGFGERCLQRADRGARGRL